MSSNEFIQATNISYLTITMVFMVAIIFAWRFKNPPKLWGSIIIFLLFAHVCVVFKPLWYDEIFSSVVSKLSWSKMMTVLSSDVHPPLHYIMEWYLIHAFGDNPIVLRLPSLFAGIGVLIVSYQLLLLWSDEQRARFGVFVLALTPVTWHYSGEARYPIFLALIVLASMLAIIKNSKLQILLIHIAPLLHAIGLFYAVALCIWAWSKNRKYAGLAFILSLLYIPMMIYQSKDIANGFWLSLISPIIAYLPNHNFVNESVGILVLSIVFAWVLIAWRANRYISLIVFGVPISLFVVSLIWHPIFLPRAMLVSTLLFIGISAISDKPKMRYITLMFVLLGFLSYSDKRMDYKSLFDWCKPYGSVLTTSTNMAIVAKYYAQDLTVYTLGVDNAHQWLSQDAKQALGFYTPSQSSNCLVFQRSYATTFYENLATTHYTKQSELKVSDFLSYEVWYGR